MKVEIHVNSGLITTNEADAITFLKSVDLSQPVLLSTSNNKPQPVYVRPGTRPSKPLPTAILDNFPFRSLLSKDDISRMLRHGRSRIHSIEGTPCRFSVTLDQFGRAIFHTHKYNPSPTIPGYTQTVKDTESLLINRHLGHIIKIGTYRYFVSYDTRLNDFVLLRTDKMYIPSRLQGITLSFRQRHALACGQRIRIGNFHAQADALTASISRIEITE